MPQKAKINQVRRAKLTQWMEDTDTTFRTLVMPVAFVITIAWMYLAFAGDVLYKEDSELFSKVYNDVFLRPLAINITVFVISIFLWSWSIFKKEETAKIWFLRMRWAKVRARWFSVGLLWLSLLIVPFEIIVGALRSYVGYGYAIEIFGIYLTVMLLATLMVMRPPIKEF